MLCFNGLFQHHRGGFEMKECGKAINEAIIRTHKLDKEEVKKAIDELEVLAFGWISGGVNKEYCKDRWDEVKSKLGIKCQQ